MKIKSSLKAAVLGGLSLHAIKTLHGKPIKPYKDPEAPSELNKPLKFKPKKNPIGYTNFVFGGEYLGHLEFKFDYRFSSPKELLIYDKSELIHWLKERILSKDDYKSKYIKVKSCDKRSITFVFDEQVWFRDTLKGAKARLGYLKNKVLIKWTALLPDLVLMRYARPFLGGYLCKELHQYFKRNRSAMKFQAHFKWLGKINPDFFDYKIDWFRQEFVLTLKNTVILGALAAAFGIKHTISKK